MENTFVKNLESEIAENQKFCETENLPQNPEENKKIDMSQEKNNSTNKIMSSTENKSQSKMPSKKLSAEMFFRDNPTENEIKMFNYVNSLTKKELMKVYIHIELSNMDVDKWVEENKEVLSKPIKTPKTKKSKNSVPKPSAKHIYKAYENYNLFTKSNQKVIDLCDKTCFGIQLLKHPYSSKVFMVADFQTLHITTKDNKKPTLKHYISIVNELGKNINKIDSISKQNGYGEPFKQFIKSIYNHSNFDEDDFDDEKITIAQLDTDDTFKKILKKEKDYNNSPTYIRNFLQKYKTDTSYKIPYLFNNTLFDIVNIDMFDSDDSIFGELFWDKYTNYTGNITLQDKDEKVDNLDWYSESMNTQEHSDSNSESNSDSKSESSNDIPVVDEEEENLEDYYIEFDKKKERYIYYKNFDMNKENYGLDIYGKGKPIPKLYENFKWRVNELKTKPNTIGDLCIKTDEYCLYDKMYISLNDKTYYKIKLAKK
jgi:DNA-directed RNA polymerase subunit N (RpoN/RPB10)